MSFDMIDTLTGRMASPRHAALPMLAILALLLALAACDAPDPAACQDDEYPAVRLEVVDGSDEPLTGASLRYRVGEGDWQSWAESLGRETTIRGRPGWYQLEVAKQGYGSQTLTLQVPADGADACRPIAQPVTLQLARTPCPEPPAALTLTVDPPQRGLEATVRLPGSGRQQLACQDAAGDACGAFSFDLTEPGQHQLTLEGLPGLGQMRVVSDVVVYEAPPVDLRLQHRGAEDITSSGGAEMIAYSFPVRWDEANCLLADFRDMETTYADSGPPFEPGDSERRPPLTLRYMGSLTITDLGAAECQAEPVLTALPFGVDLPAGANPSAVQVQVNYGEGWQKAECDIEDGRFVCWAQVPNPLIDRPLVASAQAKGETTTGLSLPFDGLCLLFG